MWEAAGRPARSAAEAPPLGQIGDYTFEVGELTKRVATEYERLVRA